MLETGANKDMYPNIKTTDADDLVDRHAGLVQRIAYHLSARLPPSVMVDDLIQAGMLGLLDASKHYDPTQGASFETYATIRIRGSMLDELRRNDWAPKSVHKKARDLMAAMQRVETETGRNAGSQEVAKEMGISMDEYHRILQNASSCRVLNFVELGVSDEMIGESMHARIPGPMEGLVTEQFRSTLVEAIDGLPEREQMVVSLYYDDELTLREIGEVLGVSESRISQLLSQAHLRMRTKMSEFAEGQQDDS